MRINYLKGENTMIYYKIEPGEYDNAQIKLKKIIKKGRVAIEKLKKGKYYMTAEIQSPDDLIIKLVSNGRVIKEFVNAKIISCIIENKENSHIQIITSKSRILNGGISITRLA